MPNTLEGRHALVTGANTGIGRVTALELAKQGAQVLVAVRSLEKVKDLIEEARVATGRHAIEAVELDLSDFASIRACASAVLARDQPLQLLINNAGLAGSRGRSKSGFELIFGVNHVGTFLFTQLLLERVLESASAASPARIVTVASRAHYQCKKLDFDVLRNSTKTVTTTPEYAASKLANVLFSAELSRRLEGKHVTTYSLHPGVVATDIWRGVPWPFRSLMKLGMITPEEGAKTTLHCATSAQAGAESGLYYDKQKPVKPSALALDEGLARELWRRSEEWVA
jgi:NAD(P)-dependent dehydrogenase (short-subunit alcohol dehydrogenase family)